MDPELAFLLAQYLAQNCSLDIHAHCGQELTPGGSIRLTEPGSPWEYHHGPSCPQPCPETDYSNPNQPYFWDHEEMN